MSLLHDVERLAFPRFPGSEGEKRAADLVAARLTDAGLDVTREPFRASRTALGRLRLWLHGVVAIAVVVFAAIALGGFWGVWSAAAQTILSKTVAPTEQGRLQGALASVRAACQVFTPAIFNGAFALGVSLDVRWAGAPMLVSAALLALALPFALAATRGFDSAPAASA